MDFFETQSLMKSFKWCVGYYVAAFVIMSQYRAIELRYLYQNYRELHDTGNIGLPSKWYIGGAVVLWVYRRSLCISITLQH